MAVPIVLVTLLVADPALADTLPPSDPPSAPEVEVPVPESDLPVEPTPYDPQEPAGEGGPDTGAIYGPPPIADRSILPSMAPFVPPPLDPEVVAASRARLMAQARAAQAWSADSSGTGASTGVPAPAALAAPTALETAAQVRTQQITLFLSLVRIGLDRLTGRMPPRTWPVPHEGPRAV